jgi:hypothetical protein
MSSGPNGKPKWESADDEAYALIHSDLHKHFKDLCEHTGNDDLYEYVEAQANSMNREEKTKMRLRYLMSLRDKGNRSRNIAISDYFTQMLLSPIMRTVKSFTNKYFNGKSASHNHAEGFRILKDFLKVGVMSYDIKSWTEALPAIVQKQVVSHLFSEDIAEAWYNLVVKCPWKVKKNRHQKNLPDTIVFARGQGMGTAGSFDIATVTTLLILQMIYEQDYKTELSRAIFNETGDDLVCFDPDKHILKVFTEDLGMEISFPKNKEATKENLVAEYVSRNINYGVEVSRISANICRAVDNNILDIPELCRHIEERIEHNELHIPLRKIFTSNRLGPHMWPRYVRTFYLLTIIYPNRPGMSLLKNSLIKDFPESRNDVLIQNFENPESLEAIRNSFYLYSNTTLLNSIVGKAGKIHESAIVVASNPEDLKNLGDPVYWWKNHEETIAEKTSKLALSESFDAHNEIYVISKSDKLPRGSYSVDRYPNVDEMFDKLESIEQRLTFKELGVISTNKLPWRPKTSRLYKYVKSLVALSLDGSNLNIINKYDQVNTVSKIVISDEIEMETDYMLPSVQMKFLGLKGQRILEQYYS